MSPRPKSLASMGAVVGAISLVGLLSVPAAASDRVVVVQAGQTLSQIAVREGVPIATLVAMNQIADPNRIYAGQRLLVARDGSGSGAAPPAPALTTPSATHRVSRGETLTAIARRYGTTIAAIAAANGLANPSYIRAGQLLAIPGAAPAVAAPSAPAAAMPPSMAALVASRLAVRDLIAAEAQRQGVPVAFALAVAWQESGWQQRVVSPAGAIGIMQLIPATGDWVAGSLLGEPVNLYDAASNVRAGVRLLRHYLDRYADRSLALAAYYQGQTATDRHGVYAMTRPYIASIVRLEQLFSS